MHHRFHSTSVIGGADGPTAIFPSGGIPMSVIVLGGVALLAVIIGIAVAVARK